MAGERHELAYTENLLHPRRLSDAPRLPGILGAIQTVQVMRGLARDGSRDPLILQIAQEIFPPEHDVPSRTRIEALRSWCAVRFKYENDPRGMERLWTPRFSADQYRVLGYIRGDCDDLATFQATIALAGGLKPRYKAVSLRPDRRFDHILTEIRDGSIWRSVDVFNRANKPYTNELVWGV